MVNSHRTLAVAQHKGFHHGHDRPGCAWDHRRHLDPAETLNTTGRFVFLSFRFSSFGLQQFDAASFFAVRCSGAVYFFNIGNAARFSAGAARSRAKSFGALVQLRRCSFFKSQSESAVGTEVLKNSVALDAHPSTFFLLTNQIGNFRIRTHWRHTLCSGPSQQVKPWQTSDDRQGCLSY